MKFRYMILLIALISLVSCGKPETFGEKITGDSPEVSIKELFEKPDEFESKTVTLQGEIGQICPSGCWFFVKQNENELYVNLSPSGFAIPQKSGAEVKVEGKLLAHNNSLIMVAKGVEIK